MHLRSLGASYNKGIGQTNHLHHGLFLLRHAGGHVASAAEATHRGGHPRDVHNAVLKRTKKIYEKECCIDLVGLCRMAARKFGDLETPDVLRRRKFITGGAADQLRIT